jgi:hypothetical protein
MNRNSKKLSLNQAGIYLTLTAIGYSTAGVAFKLVDCPMVISGLRGIIVLTFGAI